MGSSWRNNSPQPSEKTRNKRIWWEGCMFVKPGGITNAWNQLKAAWEYFRRCWISAELMGHEGLCWTQRPLGQVLNPSEEATHRGTMGNRLKHDIPEAWTNHCSRMRHRESKVSHEIIRFLHDHDCARYKSSHCLVCLAGKSNMLLEEIKTKLWIQNTAGCLEEQQPAPVPQFTRSHGVSSSTPPSTSLCSLPLSSYSLLCILKCFIWSNSFIFFHPTMWIFLHLSHFLT